jgi:hypothetical protein
VRRACDTNYTYTAPLASPTGERNRFCNISGGKETARLERRMEGGRGGGRGSADDDDDDERDNPYDDFAFLLSIDCGGGATVVRRFILPFF